MKEIETTRLLLRRWRGGDLSAYARICADPEVMKYLPEASSGKECGADYWIRAALGGAGFGLSAVEERCSGEFIGYIGLICHEDWPEGEHKTEGGWKLSRVRWGQGLATEGGCERSLRVRGIRSAADYQHYAPKNAASRRVMEKAGLG